MDVRAEPLGLGMGANARGVANAPDPPFLEDCQEFVVADADSERFPVERVFQLTPHLLAYLGAVPAERSRRFLDSPVDEGVLLQPRQPTVGYEVAQFLVGRCSLAETSIQVGFESLSGPAQRRSVRRRGAQIPPGTGIATCRTPDREVTVGVAVRVGLDDVPGTAGRACLHVRDALGSLLGQPFQIVHDPQEGSDDAVAQSGITGARAFS
ncbi:hypothetical protein [Nocardia sp. NPDC019304]|uniref:hypothetical protein n=1 Tax=unclassified Nocardia TaxID=2637762 RepID=UPI0033CB7964